MFESFFDKSFTLSRPVIAIGTDGQQTTSYSIIKENIPGNLQPLTGVLLNSDMGIIGTSNSWLFIKKFSDGTEVKQSDRIKDEVTNKEYDIVAIDTWNYHLEIKLTQITK